MGERSGPESRDLMQLHGEISGPDDDDGFNYTTGQA